MKGSHKLVPLNLTTGEREAIGRIKVAYQHFTYYGHKNNPQLRDNIAKFIENQGNQGNQGNTPSDSAIVADVIMERSIKPFMKSVDREHMWFTIRTTIPSPDFDTPRWHCDGNFWTPKDGEVVVKYAAVLKGPGTLVKEDGDEVREVFREIERTMVEDMKGVERVDGVEDGGMIREAYRAIFDGALKKYPNTPTDNEHGLVFVVGNKERCAIHSEPKLDSDRLFYSIVPGREEEIREMVEIRGEKWEVFKVNRVTAL